MATTAAASCRCGPALLAAAVLLAACCAAALDEALTPEEVCPGAVAIAHEYWPDPEEIGELGHRFAMYDSECVVKGQPSCFDGPSGTECSIDWGACAVFCGPNTYFDNNGCTRCGNGFQGRASGGAPPAAPGASPPPLGLGGAECPDMHVALALPVGEMARRLSKTFCQPGGFVGFSFVGSFLDHMDADGDGTHNCSEYKRAHVSRAYTPGRRLARPRCKLSDRGYNAMFWINNGRAPPAKGDAAP
ncbi:hypothetical protein HT031_004641 [Scenedesmus sp. PABB004]|nr:hypothetical protein HT031_004641 [Scenedesmus sp. PABB004]